MSPSPDANCTERKGPAAAEHERPSSPGDEGAHARLLRELLEGQERERKALARRLHDGLCQHLTAVLLGLQVAREAESWEEAQGCLDGLRVSCAEALSDARQILGELRPGALDDFGLEAGLKQLAAQGPGACGLAVTVEADDLAGPRLPDEVETGLYRIAEECLRLFGERASARNAHITLRRSPELVELVVQHDGPRPLDGDSGLADLRERAALFGGSFTLDSAPGSGAAVTVRVRLGNEDHGEDPRVDCR
jgi:signal transduction histidine kinase